jgi:cytochrome c
MPALRSSLFPCLVSPLAAVSLFIIAPVSQANMELAKAKNCTVCHAVDKKIIGPSYQEVAVKYAKDKDAIAKLKEKVLKGGVGTLVKWILATKK